MMEEGEPYVITEMAVAGLERDRGQRRMILLYNIHLSLLFVLGLVFSTIWKFELPPGYDWRHIIGIPFIVPILMIMPELHVGIKAKTGGVISCLLNLAWFGVGVWVLWTWLVRKTAAPVTFVCTMAMMVLDMVWIFLMEFHSGFRGYLRDISNPGILVMKFSHKRIDKAVKTILAVCIVAELAVSFLLDIFYF